MKIVCGYAARPAQRNSSSMARQSDTKRTELERAALRSCTTSQAKPCKFGSTKAGRTQGEAQQSFAYCLGGPDARPPGAAFRPVKRLCFLSATVGGYLHYVFAASPLPESLTRGIDGQLGRAVTGHTGASVGANTFICPLNAVLPHSLDGLEMFSAVALWRDVTVTKMLTRLNHALQPSAIPLECLAGGA